VINSITLELDLADDPNVLLRIVGICHQRRCRIVSLHYDLDYKSGRLTLSVDAENRRAERLELWLSGVVHVLAARRIHPPSVLDSGSAPPLSCSQALRVNALPPATPTTGLI
jgi:acetolactate synthase regulatory subunit